MRRAAEVVAFLGVSAAVHAGVVTGLGGTLGGAQGQGEGGASRVTLAAAPDTLAVLADRWMTAPSVEAAAPRAPMVPDLAEPPPTISAESAHRGGLAPAAPLPAETDAAPAATGATPAPIWSAPDVLSGMPAGLPAPSPAAPAALPVTPGPDTAPMRSAPARADAPSLPVAPVAETAAPQPPRGTALAALRSPRPDLRPVRSVAPTAASPEPSAPQPARSASGQGGGTIQGTAPTATPVQPALTAGQRQSLMAQWGSRILSRIERARPRVSGRGQVVLALRISRDGQLAGLSVARSSGDADIDAAALAAVRNAGRFPAAPDGLTESSYGFSLPIRFR